MNRKRYVLIADGSSDKCLIPIINFALRQTFPDIIFEGEIANFGFLSKPPQAISTKIEKALDLYNAPDWLFIHRDAEKENEPLLARVKEIENAIAASNTDTDKHTFIKIIPIKMTEAWLLIDEKAIRHAAGNPNGKVLISLPSVNQLEKLDNPKEVLFDLLKKASELSGRRLDKFSVHKARHLVAELIQDYSILEKLDGFEFLMQQIRSQALIFSQNN